MPLALQSVVPSLANDLALAEALLRAKADASKSKLDTYAITLAEAGQYSTAEQAAATAQTQRAIGRRGGLLTQELTTTNPGRWSVWAAGLYLHGQLAPESLESLLLTAIALHMLREKPLWSDLEALLRSPDDDCRDLPIAQKTALWIGFDARATLVAQLLRDEPIDIRATAAGTGLWGKQYLLSGCGRGLLAQGSDATFLSAETAQGMSCFFVPRWCDDGLRNKLVVQPMRGVVGYHPVSQIDLQTASGYLLGEEGQAEKIFYRAAGVLRLGHTLAGCALLRQSLVHAVTTVRQMHNPAIMPLLESTLVDMALESEASLILAMRLAQACENCDSAADTSPPLVDLAYKNIIIPAAQYWVGRRAMEFTGELLEWIGGRGLLNDPLGQRITQLFLAAPGPARGEGTGNSLCLEVLRALRQNKSAANILLEHLEDISNHDPRILAQLYALRAMLAQPPVEQERMGRMLVQRLILTTQACLLRRDAPPAVAQAFINTRLAHTGAGRVLGALDTRKIDLEQLLERALPP